MEEGLREMGCGGKIGNKMRRESSGASFLNVWNWGRPGGESKTRGGVWSGRTPRATSFVLPAAPPTGGEPLLRHAAAAARALRPREPSGPHPRAGPAPHRPVSPGNSAAAGRAAPAGVAPASHELLWSLDNESADLRAAPGQGGHALFGAPAPRKGHAGGRAVETCVVLNDRTSRGLVTVVTVAQTCSPKAKSRPHRQF